MVDNGILWLSSDYQVPKQLWDTANWNTNPNINVRNFILRLRVRCADTYRFLFYIYFVELRILKGRATFQKQLYHFSTNFHHISPQYNLSSFEEQNKMYVRVKVLSNFLLYRCISLRCLNVSEVGKSTWWCMLKIGSHALKRSLMQCLYSQQYAC